jgi:hypothetical protein
VNRPADTALALSEDELFGWPAWTITRGDLALSLVPSVGGRIMSLRWRGSELYFVHPELRGRPPQAVLAEADGATFPLWGGDKTWLAPQDRWPDAVPFPTLDSGGYELTVERATAEEATVAMLSAVDDASGMQVRRTVSVSVGAVPWTVTSEVTNRSGRTALWAPWDVQMLSRPARVFVPRASDSAFPGGVRTFADEGESVEARAEVVHEFGSCAAVDCERAVEFKFGVDSSARWALALLRGGGGEHLAYVVDARDDPTGPAYPHRCSVEVYNSAGFDYLELELLGRLRPLAPGDSVTLIERRSLLSLATPPTDCGEVEMLVGGRDAPAASP